MLGNNYIIYFDNYNLQAWLLIELMLCGTSVPLPRAIRRRRVSFDIRLT